MFTGERGRPMALDTLSGYLTQFEKKYDLPHIHAHKFRHSMASVLYTCTLGLMFFGWWHDLGVILNGKFKDNVGEYLRA